MAINLTRSGGTHKKKTLSLLVVAAAATADMTAADDYLVGYLPADAVVTDAFVFTRETGAANAVTVGTTEGGTEILSAGDAAAAGASGTFTGASDTGSGVPVYVGVSAAVDGVFEIHIEYNEGELNTGDLTLID